jgi:protein tyrosine phosphatase (PTP) superfamily phosphohydrolase (DUF442 family)
LLAAPLFAAETNAPAARPPQWAQPLTIAGITNCFRVTTNLYRGSQPSANGMKNLKALGIKTVVNLRSFHSDKDEVADTSLQSIRFTTKPWHTEQKEIVGFLKVMANTNNWPVFVHCQRGADRTGTMCAMYRLAVCGWAKEEALAELRDGGFHFAPVWKNLVKLIEQADVPKLRAQSGLTP